MITFHQFLPLKQVSPAQLNLIPLSYCYFSEDVVTKALNKIRVNKTPGPDYIAPGVLKKQNIKSANLLYSQMSLIVGN